MKLRDYISKGFTSISIDNVSVTVGLNIKQELVLMGKKGLMSKSPKPSDLNDITVNQIAVVTAHVTKDVITQCGLHKVIYTNLTPTTFELTTVEGQHLLTMEFIPSPNGVLLTKNTKLCSYSSMTLESIHFIDVASLVKARLNHQAVVN